MTLAELKELVDDMVNSIGEEEAWDVQVRFASQPNWPFEYSIESMIVSEQPGPPDVVYLAEDQQLGYLPRSIKEELGW